jgi:hypothetical protein
MSTAEATGDEAVLRCPARNRYELLIDNGLVGFADYRERDGTVAIVHTEVVVARRNKGLGARLVRAALDDLRGRELKVIPSCPYVEVFIRRHPEYADLVAAG